MTQLTPEGPSHLCPWLMCVKRVWVGCWAATLYWNQRFSLEQNVNVLLLQVSFMGVCKLCLSGSSMWREEYELVLMEQGQTRASQRVLRLMRFLYCTVLPIALENVWRLIFANIRWLTTCVFICVWMSLNIIFCLPYLCLYVNVTNKLSEWTSVYDSS